MTIEKCPSCGKAMEPGYLIAGRAIFWCDHLPNLICRCGAALSKRMITCSGIACYRCKSCRIIRYLID
ncbi:MAG: PF20097 family protein [Candidatus Thorarchaeota archaeon]